MAIDKVVYELNVFIKEIIDCCVSGFNVYVSRLFLVESKTDTLIKGSLRNIRLTPKFAYIFGFYEYRGNSYFYFTAAAVFALRI